MLTKKSVPVLDALIGKHFCINVCVLQVKILRMRPYNCQQFNFMFQGSAPSPVM